MNAQPVAVKSGVGVKEGVKVGFGMFILLPILLGFASCAACLSCFSSSASRYEQIRKEHQQGLKP